jgi:hypothetical protein
MSVVVQQTAQDFVDNLYGLRVVIPSPRGFRHVTRARVEAAASIPSNSLPNLGQSGAAQASLAACSGAMHEHRSPQHYFSPCLHAPGTAAVEGQWKNHGQYNADIILGTISAPSKPQLTRRSGVHFARMRALRH